MKIHYLKLIVVFLILWVVVSPDHILSQGARPLEIQDSDIDLSAFPIVRVAVGAWDSNNQHIPPKLLANNFTVQEDNAQPRTVEATLISPTAISDKFRRLGVSFVLDIDPNLPQSRIEKIHNLACDAVKRLVMDQLRSDIVEVWAPGLGIEPLLRRSTDSGESCNAIRRLPLSNNSYRLTVNEILERLLTRQADQDVNIIVLILTRKMDPDNGLLNQRDSALSRPIYVLNFLDWRNDSMLADQDFLKRLSTRDQNGQPAILVGESADTELVSKWMGDIYKYKIRYLIEYESQVFSLEQPHDLIVRLGSNSSRTIKLVPPRPTPSGIGPISITYVAIQVFVVSSILVVVGLIGAFISYRTIRKYRWYP